MSRRKSPKESGKEARIESGSQGAQFVSEPIIVDPSSVSAMGLAQGAPACPMRFEWRGREYRVVKVLETGRQLRAHDSAETYVRSHSFRVVTECRHEIVLRCDRKVRGNPWRVYTVRKLQDDEFAGEIKSAGGCRPEHSHP